MMPQLAPYPIEVSFPDLSCWQAGNSGIDYVHSFDSGQPGPHVMINALTHGNEVCGAIVLDELLRRGVRVLRGKLTLSFANIAAYQRFDPTRPDASRFIDEDFNRIWSAQALDSARNSHERQRARAMRELVDHVDALLDLHSMHESCAPLLLSGPLAKGLHLARELGFPAQVIVDAGHTQGCRLRDYGGFSEPDNTKNALLIECGQHWEARAVSVAREATARFLHVWQLIAEDELSDWISPCVATQTVIRVTHAIVARSHDFHFMDAYRGLECIAAAGTLLAKDGNEELRTPYENCILIMPSLRQLAPGVTVLRLGQIITEDTPC